MQITSLKDHHKNTHRYLSLPKLFHHKVNYQRDVITFLPWNGRCTTPLPRCLSHLGELGTLVLTSRHPFLYLFGYFSEWQVNFVVPFNIRQKSKCSRSLHTCSTSSTCSTAKLNRNYLSICLNAFLIQTLKIGIVSAVPPSLVLLMTDNYCAMSLCQQDSLIALFPEAVSSA